MEVAPELVDRLVMEEAQSCVTEIREGLRPVAVAESDRGRAGWTSDDEGYSPEATGYHSTSSRSPTRPLSREGSRASLPEDELMNQLGIQHSSGSVSSRLRPLDEGSTAGEGWLPPKDLPLTRSRLSRRNSMVEGGPRRSLPHSRRTSFVGSDAGSDQAQPVNIGELGSQGEQVLPPSRRTSFAGSDASNTRVRLRRVSNAALIVQRLAASANADQSTAAQTVGLSRQSSVISLPLDEEK